MHDQRGRRDQREGWPHVDLHERPQKPLGSPGAGTSANHLPEPTAKPLVTGSAGRQHRRHGLGAPQLVDLDQESLGDLWGNPDRVVVSSNEPRRGVRQDEGAGAFWLGRGEEDRRWTSIDFGQERGPLGANDVQDRGQLLGIGLPRRQRVGRKGVREARASPVNDDQPAERRERATGQGDPRIFPGDVEVTETSRVRTRSGGPSPSTW